MTLSKLVLMAISSYSMLDVAESTKRSGDIVKRRKFSTILILRNDISAEAIVGLIVRKYVN